MQTHPNLAYIAHLSNMRSEHIDCRDEMTERGFPCIISNDLNNGKEYPHCDVSQALRVNTMRLSTLNNPRNVFFIFFIEDSTFDNIANFELGIAANSIEHIAFIGPKLKAGHQLIETLGVHYDSWENFITRHFDFGQTSL